MCVQLPRWCVTKSYLVKILKILFFSETSVASPSTTGHEKQERRPPLKEGNRSKRPFPPPRTQNIAGRPRYNKQDIFHFDI